MNGSFDQVVYCETTEPLIGNSAGVQAAASSLDPENLKYWNTLLYSLVTVDHPYPTLSYSVSEERGQAALLYRISEVDNRTRPFIHILIGPSEELTPKLALGSLEWNWIGAIRKRSEVGANILPKIRGEVLQSFRAAAEAGWESVAQTGARPPEVDRAILDIRDRGGEDRTLLPLTDNDSLSSLGDGKFVIFTSAGLAAVDQQAAARFPVQILARLLLRLGGSGVDIVSKRLIGTGFSTHESEYRSGQATLPRWVFATQEDPGMYSVGRLSIDLRNINLSSADANKADVDEFKKYFHAASARYQLQPVANMAASAAPPAKEELAEEQRAEEQRAEEQRAEEQRAEEQRAEEQRAAAADPLPTIPPSPDGERPGEKPLVGVVQGETPGPWSSPVAQPLLPLDNLNVDPPGPPPSPDSGRATVPPPPAPRPTPVPPPQQGPTDYTSMPDHTLIEELSYIEIYQFDSMIRELRRRATREYHAERLQQGAPIDVADIRKRLIRSNFHIIDAFSHSDQQLVTELYCALCAFAASDQEPRKADKKVVNDFLSVLANNKTYQVRGPDQVRYSPLARAIVYTLAERQGDPRDTEMPRSMAAYVVPFVGDARLHYLGIPIEPTDKADEHAQRSASEARSTLSAKQDIIILLVVLSVVLVAVCIGYAA